MSRPSPLFADLRATTRSCYRVYSRLLATRTYSRDGRGREIIAISRVVQRKIAQADCPQQFDLLRPRAVRGTSCPWGALRVLSGHRPRPATAEPPPVTRSTAQPDQR